MSGGDIFPRKRVETCLHISSRFQVDIVTGHRRASLRECADCGQPLLLGLDDWILAFSARADTRPINTPTELAAITRNLNTYELRQGRLHHRQPKDIRRNPASQSPWPILTQHKCDFPIPTWNRPTSTQPFIPNPDAEPPF